MHTTAPPSARLGRPLGTGRDWRRRLLRHHLPLALASTALLVLLLGITRGSSPPQLDMLSGGALPEQAPAMAHGGQQPAAGWSPSFDLDSRSFMARSATATGYLATGLLALTLLIGPANLLLRRRNPASTSLARDTGIWAAITGILHVILGFQVHGGGQSTTIVRYFVADGVVLTNSFGLANWTGLAALVIVAGLLSISTDRALRQLKAKRWKNLQRFNYALFALVVLHAFFYGALLRATSTFTLLLLSILTAVLVGQTIGIWLWRRRSAYTTDVHAGTNA